MTLRKKTVMFVIATTVIALFIVFVVVDAVVLNGFRTVENNAINKDANRVLYSVQERLHNLEALSTNYSAWNDTWNFMTQKHLNDISQDPFITDNYPSFTFTQKDVNFILLVEPNGHVLFQDGYDVQTGHPLKVPSSVVQSLLSPQYHLLSFSKAGSQESGLIPTSTFPLLVASMPIVQSDGTGPIHGTVIFARYLDNHELALLSDDTNLHLQLSSIKKDEYLPLKDPNHPTVWDVAAGTTLTEYATLRDIDGNPVALVQFQEPRLIYEQGWRVVFIYMGICSVLVFAIVMLAVFFLEQIVLKRFSLFSNQMKEIRMRRDFSARAYLDTRDEIGEMAEAFNDMMASLESSAQTIDYQAQHDALTSLYNRGAFYGAITHELNAFGPGRAGFSLVLVDIDRFHWINERYGHDVADMVLVQLAERIQAFCEAGEFVARLGGDEFAVLIPQVTEQEIVEVWCKTFLRYLEVPMHIGEQSLGVQASLGVSIAPRDGESPSVLLRNADTAMLRAKQLGAGQYVIVTTQMKEFVDREVRMRDELTHALKREQFHLVYQPKVNAQSGSIVGAEALVRWTHPELGPIRPDEFIPIAESSGMMVDIGDWILRQACLQCKQWEAVAPDLAYIAVNVSNSQLEDSHFVKRVQDALKDTGLTPLRLELEVTEHTAMNQVERVIQQLGELKRMGVRVAIDDFGTGYSSLNYLQQFPIDRLKIDRSFVRNLQRDVGAETIVQAVIDLGHALRLSVIAEGVETPEHMEFLRSRGCDEVQGYLSGRPVEAAEWDSWLAK